MAFVTTTKQLLVGGGSPTYYTNLLNTSVSAGTANVTLNINAATGYSPNAYFSQFRVRAKTNIIGTNATCAIGNIWATDGNSSNTVLVRASGFTLTSNGAALDQTFGILQTDILANAVVVQVNVVNNTTTFDVEFEAV